jgi:hypothetical protein
MSFFASLERLTFYTVSVSLVKKQVNETGTDGASRRASDRYGTGRCRIFRETVLGSLGERAVALHYRGPVNGGGAQAGDSPDTI